MMDRIQEVLVGLFEEIAEDLEESERSYPGYEGTDTQGALLEIRDRLERARALAKAYENSY